MALLEQWRAMAYSETANKADLQRLWAVYFEKEKEIYAQLLKNPDEVVTGTVKELAEKYDVEMPIIMEVNKLLFENKPASEAVKDLMQREKQGEISWEL